MGNPTDDAFSYYDQAVSQVGGHFGAPTSPQFQGSRPSGFSSQGAQNMGNHNFAPPMGIQSSNPTVGILGNMALQGIFGNDMANIRPINQPGLSAQDFVEGRQRSAVSQGMMKDLHQLNSSYLAPRVGNAGYNLGAQTLFDTLNPGGSQVQAFNQIYSGQGKAFGASQTAQKEGAYNSLLQMNETFEQETGANKGGWDYRKSYGFDRNETADNADVAIRRGIGGMSSEKFADAVSKGEGGDMMRDNNRVFSAAREVFGKDKTADQLGELITKMSDGATGLDASQTTELLQKISATSKVVDMSTEAFSAYSDLLKDMYHSVGISGSSIAGQVSRSAKDAKISTELGRESGDTTLGDLDKNLESQGRNGANLMKSQGMKKVKALAAIASNMTEEQKASVQIKGMGTLAEVMKKGGVYEQALVSGDADTLKKITDAANQSESPFLGKGALSRRARSFSEEDEAMAGKMFDFSKTGDIQGNALRKNLSKGIAGSIDKNIMSKIGKDGIDKIMGKMDSFGESSDSKKVLAAIQGELGGMGLGAREQQDLATQFANESAARMNNKGLVGQYGYKSRNDANVAFARTSEKGKLKSAQMDSDEDKSMQQQQYLAEISGDVMRPLGSRELGGMALDLFKDIQNGTIKGEEYQDKDGKTDFSKVKELSKKYVKGGLKMDETRAMMKAASPEAMQEATDAGAEAYDQAIGSGSDEQSARKAKTAAMREQVKKIYESELDEKPGERTDDQLDEEEKQERDDAMKKSGDIEKEGAGAPGGGPGKVGPGPNDVLGDSGKGGEKVEALVAEAQRQTGLLETIAGKLPDSNKIASVSKPNSAPNKMSSLGGT